MSPNCTCSGCVLDGINCNIPLYFKSFSYLEFNISGNYSYLFELNNCTRGQPAINVSFKYVNESFATVNYSVTSNYSFNGVYGFYNQSKLNTNLSICIYPDYANFTGDLNIYYALGSSPYTYSLSSFNYDNQTNFLSLYVSEGATLVLLNVKNNLNRNLQDVYISVMQYDPTTASYKLSSNVVTDSSGNAVVPLILNTQWYKFILTYNGVVELISGPSLIVSTTQYFVISPSGDDLIDELSTYDSMYKNLSYGNSSHYVTFIWSDASLSVTSVCLKVTKTNNTATDAIVYTNCSYDSTGQLAYFVSERSNASYDAYGTIYIGSSINAPLWLAFDFGSYVDQIGKAKKLDLLFYALAIVVAIIFGFITTSPMIAIIMMMVAIDLLSVPKFISINPAALVALNILAGIVVWRLSKAQ